MPESVSSAGLSFQATPAPRLPAAPMQYVSQQSAISQPTQAVPPQFGYVILVFIYSWVMLAYLGVKVGIARKKYNVKYPDMYSDKEPLFNCIQRAHQNTLEIYPQWMIFQLIAGIVYPVTASLFGIIWVTSRFSYAWGYYTGVPEKRKIGSYGYIGFLGVIALSLIVAFKTIFSP